MRLIPCAPLLLLCLPFLIAACAAQSPGTAAAPSEPSARLGEAVDATALRLMKEARLPGLALAVIENGRVSYVKAYGLRDVAQGAPLRTDTVMYGASLTKAAFAYMVMQLVDEGRVDLDTPLERYLPKPLPEYPKYADLASDARWKQLTPSLYRPGSAWCCSAGARVPPSSRAAMTTSPTTSPSASSGRSAACCSWPTA